MADEVDVLALCNIVKEQWRLEKQRADRLQTQVSQMKPVVEAAQELVRGRNEQYGNASNPEWWQGHDWKLAVAVADYGLFQE